MSSFAGTQPTALGATPRADSSPVRSMRKSCHFCRSRKIRCSGQSICSACQERNLDCVYGREGAKGRPKLSVSKTASTRGISSKTKSKASGPKIQDQSALQSNPHSAPNEDSNLLSSPLTFQSWEHLINQPDCNSSHSIAEELSHIFIRLFSIQLHPEVIDSQPSNAIDAFSRKSSESRTDFQIGHDFKPPMTYDQPMRLIIENLVEMIAFRFGNLSCCPTNSEDSSTIFKDCLDADCTQSMFDDTGNLPNPLAQYSNYQTLQMLDIWFSHHPLSFLLSKTLLIQNYRNGTQSDLILAIVLGDVLSAQQSNEGRSRGADLFNWATRQLYSSTSHEITLPLLQALILLGWHELCGTRARRAVSYFLYATSLAPNLRKPDLDSNRINGLDIGEVEAELAHNARWLAFSVILWMFMQCDAPLLDLLPSTQVLTNFPPINETASIVYALDVASDNTSTLPHQAKAISDLWPISHIASTTAHIYALYPRHKPASALLTPLGTPSWESQTLRRLQNLNDASHSAPQDFSLLCHKVRHILVGAVAFLEKRNEDPASQNLVLSAYHTLIIHFLFPSCHLLNGGRDVLITDGLIEDFLNSLKALLRVTPDLHPSSAGGRMRLCESDYSVSAEVFMIGLDACSRVYAHLQSAARLNSEAASTTRQEELIMLASGLRALLKRGDDLASYATHLQNLAKNDKLRNTKRSKAVKRQLKQVVQQFEYPDKCFNISSSRRSSQSPSISSASHPRDFTPKLVHTSSNDSSTTETSTRHNRMSSTDRLGFPMHEQVSINNQFFGSADPFVVGMAPSGIDQELEPKFNIGQDESLVDGYFDSYNLAQDMQDMSEKIVDGTYHSTFNDFVGEMPLVSSGEVMRM